MSPRLRLTRRFRSTAQGIDPPGGRRGEPADRLQRAAERQHVDDRPQRESHARRGTVKLALDRNLDIRVQRLNPQLQDIALMSAKAFYAPSLTTAINQSNTVGTPSSQLQLSSGGRGITQDRTVYQRGRRPSKSGGAAARVGASLNNNRAESDSNNVLFNPQFARTGRSSTRSRYSATSRSTPRAGRSGHQGQPRCLRYPAARVDDQSRLERAATRAGITSSRPWPSRWRGSRSSSPTSW